MRRPKARRPSRPPGHTSRSRVRPRRASPQRRKSAAGRCRRPPEDCRANRGHASPRGARPLRRSGRHSEPHPRPRSSCRDLLRAPALLRRCWRSIRGPNSPDRAGPQSLRCRPGCPAKAWRSPHTTYRSARLARRDAAEKSSGWRSPRRPSSAVRTLGSRRRPAGSRVGRRSSRRGLEALRCRAPERVVFPSPRNRAVPASANPVRTRGRIESRCRSGPSAARRGLGSGHSTTTMASRIASSQPMFSSSTRPRSR